MTQQQVMNQRAEPGQPDAPAAGDQPARQEAIKQIERGRRFWVRATVSTVGMIWRPSGPLRSITTRAAGRLHSRMGHWPLQSQMARRCRDINARIMEVRHE